MRINLADIVAPPITAPEIKSAAGPVSAFVPSLINGFRQLGGSQAPQPATVLPTPATRPAAPQPSHPPVPRPSAPRPTAPQPVVFNPRQQPPLPDNLPTYPGMDPEALTRGYQAQRHVWSGNLASFQRVHPQQHTQLRGNPYTRATEQYNSLPPEYQQAFRDLEVAQIQNYINPYHRPSQNARVPYNSLGYYGVPHWLAPQAPGAEGPSPGVAALAQRYHLDPSSNVVSQALGQLSTEMSPQDALMRLARSRDRSAVGSRAAAQQADVGSRLADAYGMIRHSPITGNLEDVDPRLLRNPEGAYGAVRDTVTNAAVGVPYGLAQLLGGNTTPIRQAMRGVAAAPNHFLGTDFGHDWAHNDMSGVGPGIDVGQNLPTTPPVFGSVIDPTSGQIRPGLVNAWQDATAEYAQDPNLNPLARLAARGASATLGAGDDLIFGGLLPGGNSMGGAAANIARSRVAGELLDPNSDNTIGQRLVNAPIAWVQGHLTPVMPAMETAHQAIQEIPGVGTLPEDLANRIRATTSESESPWLRSVGGFAAGAAEALPEALLLKRLGVFPRAAELTGLMGLGGAVDSWRAGPHQTDLSRNELSRTERLQQDAATQQLYGIVNDAQQGLSVDEARLTRLRQSDPAAADAATEMVNRTPLGQAFLTGRELIQRDPAAAVQQGLEARDQILQGPLARPNGLQAVQDVAGGGGAPPDIVAQNQDTLVNQLGEKDAFAALREMTPWQHLLLWGGVSIGAIGLLGAMSEDGDMGDWLMTLLGLGAAAGTAAHAGLLGPGAQQFTQKWTNPVSYLDMAPDFMIDSYLNSMSPEDQQQLQWATLADRTGLGQGVVRQRFADRGINPEQQQRIIDRWNAIH